MSGNGFYLASICTFVMRTTGTTKIHKNQCFDSMVISIHVREMERENYLNRNIYTRGITPCT